MDGLQFIYRFYFYHDSIFHEKVQSIPAIQLNPAVDDR